MRYVAAVIFAILTTGAALHADDATLYGQKIVFSSQVKYGAVFSKTLYITGSSPYYLVDSGSTPTRVRLDTSVNTVGAAGASSANIQIQSQVAPAMSQQSNCEASIRIRATDVSQSEIKITAYGQYKLPWADTDSTWTANAYLWGQDSVRLTHTPPNVTTSFTTRRWYFYPAGDNLRLNVQRVNVGAADTVALKMEVRCR